MGIADTYTKGRVLGTGTFGEVILATHKETGEVVAIKKIRVEDKKQVGCLCISPEDISNSLRVSKVPSQHEDRTSFLLLLLQTCA